MTHNQATGNRVREFRTSSGMTQAELAERAGISRTAVTAIEGDRLVPSVAAAISLAEALGSTVEALFRPNSNSNEPVSWASDPQSSNQPFWQAEVGGRQWLYPSGTAPMHTPLPDQFLSESRRSGSEPDSLSRQTLVIACCDPAAGLLSSLFEQMTGKRLLVLHRSSRQALELLREGRVHLAGLHFSTQEEPERNSEIVRETLGTGYQLLRVTKWQEGIVTTSGSRFRSVNSVLRSKLKWVGREPGSGARRCLDHLFGERPSPRFLARNHRAVAEAVQSGWVDAGICVQITGAEAGLSFLPVQEEAYDLCFPTSVVDDPRVKSLLRVVRSPEYRQLLGTLPGYSTAETGDLMKVS